MLNPIHISKCSYVTFKTTNIVTNINIT